MEPLKREPISSARTLRVWMPLFFTKTSPAILAAVFSKSLPLTFEQKKTNKKEREPTKINILVLSFLFFKAYIL